ncbi:MAG TPA: hemerythrin domain-containing protein [Mycobacteriales bacterium]|jgi:hypothetical protein|nr:hemerythrin domain-containing protein [Mycobacteriales bacterium]
MPVTADTISAITHHHAQLQQSLSDRVAAVMTAARTGASHDEPVSELRRLLAGDIVPHARAEEDVLYAAATAATLRPLVAGMIFEHETLLQLAGRLAHVITSVDAAATAYAIEAVFVGHVRRENELLLPVLAADPAVDLPALLPLMEQRLATYQGAVPDETSSPTHPRRRAHPTQSRHAHTPHRHASPRQPRSLP